ncbi:MAG: H-type lectin domain-containing protein [Pseudomonadota bacterium]
MKRLRNHLIGVDQGEHVLFSHFEEDGPMWSGKGPRVVKTPVTFAEPFRAPPSVQVALSMWDMDNAANSRADMRAEAVTVSGFELIFRTWGDTRVARVRANWTAIGELRQADEWDLY